MDIGVVPVSVFQPFGIKVKKFVGTNCCWIDCLMSTKQHSRPSLTTSTGKNHSHSLLSVVCLCFCSCMCFSVQCFSECNQMNIDNLAMVFGPTLFKSDGKDSNARCAIMDLIYHYKDIFEV